MNDSILESIKALLGPDSAYTVFDQDLLIHINTALATLTPIGGGPANGFRSANKSILDECHEGNL